MAESRDFSIYTAASPRKQDEKTKAQLPLWKPVYCEKCGAWDSWQLEASTDKDKIRATCSCENRMDFALKLTVGKTPRAGNGMPFKKGAEWG